MSLCMQKVLKDDELSTVNECLKTLDFKADFRHRFPTIIVTSIYTGCWFVGGDDLTEALHDL